MKRDGRFPGDQAEITFTDLFVEQISEMTNQEREEVLSAAVALCGSPGGKHQLSDALTDNDSPMSAPAFVLNTMRGLGPRFASAATVISMTDPMPTFIRVRSMLLMEKMQ